MGARTATSRRPRFAAPIGLLLVVLVVGGGRLINLYTDLLWFREVRYVSVFSTVLYTRIGLFAVFGAVMALVVGANIAIAYRLRPPFRPNSLEQQNLDRYRLAVEPFLRTALLLTAGLAGIAAGAVVSTRWQLWLGWRNAVPFGTTDAQFGRDVSYYAFTYPFQRLLLNFAFAAVVISLLAAGATHYLFGGIRIQTAGEKVVAAARAHLSVLLGVFVLLKAAAYYLDQYGLSFSARGKVTGASYTDVNAELPALKILVVIALICGLLFIANLRSRGWTLPATAFGLLLVSSVVIGGVYPAIVQQLRVRPNEIAREAPYIQRNIEATRAAYRLRTGQDVTYQPYAASANLTAAQIRADKGTIPNVRLLDPNQLRNTVESLQQIRGYYGFSPELDIDRYALDGETETYLIALREIDHDGLVENQRNWINEHMVFTHGYGLVAAPTNEVISSGEPNFVVKDIPPTGPLALTQPRIYYGELTRTYSVVGTKQREIDYPRETGADELFTYDGAGGVTLGNPLQRLLFAVRFRSRELLLSSAITDTSKIMFTRTPLERVQRVAPYLTLDQDPYPAVIDGRIVWIVDGYTTSDGFPYSQRVGFGTVTLDSRGRAQAQRQINYIRNSVKATVDAYDGTVNLYEWDTEDPVLRMWSKAFPGTVKPRATMPDGLLAHVRYPEDLFKVQRALLAQYHVEDPSAFYSEGDFWEVPGDPAYKRSNPNETLPPQPPYYMYMQLPGDTRPRFQLTSPLAARRRPNLAAFVAVSSEQSTFGQIKVLQLPTSTTVPGPQQRGATFQSDPFASQQLTLLSQQGSETVLGNLLTLPVGGGLVYVQPVYVQSRQGSTIPLLKRVFVGYGERVGFAESFAGALDIVFGTGAAPTPGPRPGPGPTPGPGTVDDALRQAVAEAAAAYQEGQDALARRDLEGYARAQKRLEAALQRAAELSGTPPPSGSPSPSPAASPSPS